MLFSVIGINQTYSFWQFRFYTICLGVFLFVKFFFAALGWNEYNTLNTIDSKLAAVCGLFLALQIIFIYGIIWSCFLAECAWLYVFYFRQSLTVTCISSIVILLPALLYITVWLLNRRSGDSSTKEIGGPNWQVASMSQIRSMSSVIFYGTQVVFLLSCISCYIQKNFQELFWIQSLFFIFIFDSRWFPPTKVKTTQKPILFFDGSCGICNHWVSYVFQEDYKHIFRFAPLQGRVASTVLPEKYIKKLSSIVLYEREDKFHVASNAILQIGSKLGGMWRLFSLLGYCIPTGIRQIFYNIIARNRYTWFSRGSEASNCSIISGVSSKAQKYFLD